MEALPAQPSPHVAHEVPPAEETKSELTTFWLMMGVVTFAALIAACVKWTPSKVWRTTRNLPGTLRERFNAPRDNRPVVSVATELENFSSADRRGGSSDQSNQPTHTAASNDNSTSPGPETTEELVESSASSPAPTLVGSDETEHTIRAVPVESLPHSPSPVYRPNRLPRDRNRFRPWLFNIL
ncbi:hypothetical protein FRC02_002134 [Tulasnella sp. 418]|nr:hypothetical protein FRC02_002134 [Tulasnella sp. 418]